MSILKTQGLTYVYGEGTPFRIAAITDVNFEINEPGLTAIIGHTGSGKSTLIQHLNGLIKPTSGTVYVDDADIWSKDEDIRKVRFKVGLVFQYPEYQLFDETVEKDIAFGPRNLGLSDAEINERVMWAADTVGLPHPLLSKSPFDLSGGEKRRAAIAGVLAMRPRVLILDEPTAGLDPRERIRFRNILSALSADRIVLIATHIVPDIEHIAKNVILIGNGNVLCQSTPDQLVNEMRGRVHEIVVPVNETQNYLSKYCISNAVFEESGYRLRIVGDSFPENSVSCDLPALEDAFLMYSGEKII